MRADRDCREGEASKKELFFKALLKATAVMKSVKSQKIRDSEPRRTLIRSSCPMCNGDDYLRKTAFVIADSITRSVHC
jgi:hypothetical protein